MGIILERGMTLERGMGNDIGTGNDIRMGYDIGMRNDIGMVNGMGNELGTCVTSSSNRGALTVPVPRVHEPLQHNLKKLNQREKK